MKKRRPTTPNNKAPTKKSSEPELKPRSDIRLKKRPISNILLQKTQELLDSYNTIFKRPIHHHFGDADAYFRQTLRNYEEFRVIKSSSSSKSARQSLSHDSFKLTPRRLSSSHYRPFSGDGDKAPAPTRDKSRPSFVKSERDFEQDEELVPHFTFPETEVDPEVFYSPSSQLLEAPIEEVDEPEETTKIMAEDTDVTYGEDDMPTEDIAPGTDTELTEGLGEYEDDFSALEMPLEPDASTMDKVEQILDQAEAELGQVAEEAPDFEGAIDSLKEALAGQGGEEVAPSGLCKCPVDEIEGDVLKELEEAERQAKETANIIYDLKKRVAQLLGTEKMTEKEAKELEEMNIELKRHMMLFEEKTKRIQFLIGKASLFDKLGGGPGIEKGTEPSHFTDGGSTADMLPKVIVCGATENNMPKIIVCDDKKKKKKKKREKADSQAQAYPAPSVMPQFAKRLNESYCMQERLAAENADLEGKRYQLQEDLLNKDHTVESLQRQLQGMQMEMRVICRENQLLNEKLAGQEKKVCPGPCSDGDAGGKTPSCICSNKAKRRPMPCGKGRNPCPADVEARLQEYSETTNQLERQLSEMEKEVHSMQTDLVAVQKERQHLEQHRRMMLAQPPPPMPPCAAPCAAPPPPCPPPIKPPCPASCNPNRPMGISSDQALRELREQYDRLQDDYKGKLTEVAGLRADNEKFKTTVKEIEDFKKFTEEKMKEMERELKHYKDEKGKGEGTKELLVEQEQQLNVAKQRFREAQDELEELRALIEDQQGQLQDYRGKYLQAQQQVEEQRRQIDMMELENSRIAEQVNLEIQRVKNQFQEKLQELTPLPDILKTTQMKLQEAQQMHLLAERNNEALTRELQAFRDRAAEMANQLEKQRSDAEMGNDEKAMLLQQLEEANAKIAELQEMSDQTKRELQEAEELAEANEKRAQEKMHEIAQLMAQLDTVREESARQVARTKDRCETVRRSMQNQISDLERQVAQSRAQAKAAQKDRDEIRQKMQAQINNLNENFEDAQMRIRNLQGHVNFLKTSYTNVFAPDATMGIIDGMDACDCGNSF